MFRWWEARTVWGGVLNISRNIVRECACSWGFPAKERPLLEMLARWVMAMSYLLKGHLRKVNFNSLIY
jgi:predicted membrane chloride channel (bestrophin family)